MKNKIENLRDHLFATIEALRDPDKPMEIDRARAISEVANSIIESAKVEVRYLDIIGGRNSSAFLDAAPALPTPAVPAAPRLVGKS